MDADGLTVVFFPEGAYGPTNNCVGIGDVLRRRGARVVFVVEESFAGTLEAKGFEERLMRLQPPPAEPEEPGQFWKDFIAETAPEFRKPTIEQIETLTVPIWQELLDGVRYVEPRLAEILDEVDPDVVVEDNVPTFPAIVTADAPWVRVLSCNPLELRDPDLPPTFSGYPTGDRSDWARFLDHYRAATADLHAEFDAFCRDHGCPPLPEGEFIHPSDHLNLYLYPEELDYRRTTPLDPTWHRLESSVRATDAPFTLPERLVGDEPLLYLSLGSLGSADTALMERLVETLADAPYRIIVSKGPRHDEYELADNMWGEEFLPQTSILPLVDLVITHGGNNTVTESMHFGKPMIVLPLFWDQYDNAQRVDETGFGVRLAPHGHDPAALLAAIERLRADRALADRLDTASRRIQATSGTERAAQFIARVGRTRRPVT